MEHISGKTFWAIVAEAKAREQRWEKEHGTIASLAVLYLQEKPNARARGRLTAHRADEIEHMLAWTFSEHSEAELDQLYDEVLRLDRMGAVDRALGDFLG